MSEDTRPAAAGMEAVIVTTGYGRLAEGEAPYRTIQALGELKSLIARSDLLLGNDTGPRHFGRAFDIPRVTVFGPTEQRWTDTSHGKESIVKVEVPCGPCHKKKCPLEEQVCMTRVTVEMVSAACEEQLSAAY